MIATEDSPEPKPACLPTSRADQTRREICRLLEGAAPMTADELAARLGFSILYVRPRVSELVTRGYLVSSHGRGQNESGRLAIKWRLA